VGCPATVVSAIKARLEPYLEEKVGHLGTGALSPAEPTLPVTVEGKINVRAITHALGLKLSQEQYFYKYAELTTMVNAVLHFLGLGDTTPAVVGRPNNGQAQSSSKRGPNCLNPASLSCDRIGGKAATRLVQSNGHWAPFPDFCTVLSLDSVDLKWQCINIDLCT
jgi:hypothetical protein